jgi:hypothetical protein
MQHSKVKKKSLPFIFDTKLCSILLRICLHVNIILSDHAAVTLPTVFLQQHPLDVQYFDKAFTAERAKLTPVQREILQSMDQTQFQGFSYTNPNATD